MADGDNFGSLAEAISAELHRAMKATEPALRAAVTGEKGATDEERMDVLMELWRSLANAVIRLAGVVEDHEHG